jgi:hypothetical protein
MAQLKSTTINGNLSVTGNFNYNNYWSGSFACNSGYTASGVLWRVGNLVIGTFIFSTKSGVTIPAWQWTTICPAGAIPSAFRPNVNRGQYIALQGVGAGQINFNADGSIVMCCYGTFGGPWAGGLQVIYFIN